MSKNFKNFNVAEMFISNTESSNQTEKIVKEVQQSETVSTKKIKDTVEPKTPTPKNTNENKQTKNKRVQLVLTESMFENMKILAELKKISVNNLISNLLLKDIQKNKEQIEKYKTLFSQFEAEMQK